MQLFEHCFYSARHSGISNLFDTVDSRVVYLGLISTLKI